MINMHGILLCHLRPTCFVREDKVRRKNGEIINNTALWILVTPRIKINNPLLYNPFFYFFFYKSNSLHYIVDCGLLNVNCWQWTSTVNRFDPSLSRVHTPQLTKDSCQSTVYNWLSTACLPQQAGSTDTWMFTGNLALDGGVVGLALGALGAAGLVLDKPASWAWFIKPKM